MKTSTWFAITLAAAVTVGGVFTLLAQDSADVPARSRTRVGQLAKEKLGLSEKQIAKAKGELRAEKSALKDSVTKLRDARIALRDRVQKPGATEEEIRAAAATVGAAEADCAVLRAKLRARIAPILTPEQQDKLNKLRNRRAALVDRAIDVALSRLTE